MRSNANLTENNLTTNDSNTSIAPSPRRRNYEMVVVRKKIK